MPQNDSVLSEVEQFKVKGRELVALAISIVASYDEIEALPRAKLFTVRRRAIVLLEEAISFVEGLLGLWTHEDGGKM